MEGLEIRLATPDDLADVNEIYNHYVQNTTSTYQTVPMTIEKRLEWFARHGGPHPVIVAEMRDRIVGWGSLSPFHERDAYRFTVENSVYICHDQRRLGIGKAILQDMIEKARTIGHHTIIAGIDAEQRASIALHEHFGFVKVAHLHQVGYKFDRWLDVVYMQLML
jgi:L-amino acid N-acyltransferase